METAIQPTIQEKFNTYHATNPEVYRLFLQYARKVKIAGFTQYSAWAIMNRIRWHHDVNTPKNGEFKGFFKLKKMSRP